jgi:hypothetical protein
MSFCNTIIFCAVDFANVKRFMYETGLIRQPTYRWVGLGSSVATTRQTGNILPGWTDWDFGLKLRRLQALAGRDTTEADWPATLKEFNGMWRRKRQVFSGSEWSAAAYNAVRFHSLKRIAKEAVRVSAKHGGETLRSWWSRRWFSTPGGSSSISKQRVREANPGLELTQFEVDKKVAIEVYDYNELVSWVDGPAYCLARCSTKHEPGFKNRALQAGNDEHSFISSYVSDGMEHQYKANGVVISQKPQDVAEWYSIQLSHFADWHVSYDYSSWNQQVMNEDMAYLNYSIASEFLKIGTDWSVDKAIAAAWLGDSNTSQYLKIQDQTHRTLFGLYSGSRNTARDNSLIHEMYQDAIAESFYNICGSRLDMKATRKSGDDETCVTKNLVEALIYVRCVEETGFDGKRSKLMIAQGNSEFLQLVLDSNKKPTYPVAPVIAVFSSGNWYKKPVRDYPSIVPSLVDQIWNMVREGMDINFGRALLASTADWFMQIPTADGLVAIDWMAYMPKTDPPHPLIPEADGKLQWPKIKIDTIFSISSDNATQDSLDSENTWWQQFDRLGQRQEKSERKHVSFARSIRHELDAEYCKEAARLLKLKQGHTNLDGIEAYNSIPSWNLLLKKAAGGTLERYSDSFEQICVRYKAPPSLVKRLMGTPQFNMLPAKFRSELRQALVTTKMKVADGNFCLPPPMRAIA